MPRNIIPPGQCKNAKDRTAFFYRAQEKLREEHNRMGKKFREGKITQEEWQRYLAEEFEPTSDEIVAGILAARRELKDSTEWDADIPIE